MKFLASLPAVAKGSVAAAVATLAAVSSAQAQQTFTYSPGAAGLSTNANFDAADLILSDYAHIVIAPNGDFTESGTLRVQNFEDGLGNTVPSGVNTSAGYGLFMTFSGTGTLVGFNPADPTALTGGTFTSLDVTLIGNPGNTDTISTNPSTNGTLVLNGTNYDLSTGSLLPGGANSVGINGVPNADVQVTQILTATGDEFFVAPTPYAAEGAFTNTTSTTTHYTSGSDVVFNITGGGGNLTFFAVPEPASLVVLGSGLLGLGFVGRRKRG